MIVEDADDSYDFAHLASALCTRYTRGAPKASGPWTFPLSYE